MTSDQSVGLGDLADWKRRVGQLYAELRESELGAAETAARFRAVKDGLFRAHPASPLDAEQRGAFAGLPYFGYREEWRLLGEVDWLEDEPSFVVPLPEGDASMRPAADIRFTSPISGDPLTLRAFWLNGYGGGVFLPFKDSTSADSTHGGGRYLYDTIKGADLGFGEPVVLDFNYAYHPSCAYNPRWVCPLAPPENVLLEPIEAGERLA